MSTSDGRSREGSPEDAGRSAEELMNQVRFLEAEVTDLRRRLGLAQLQPRRRHFSQLNASIPIMHGAGQMEAGFGVSQIVLLAVIGHRISRQSSTRTITSQ